MRGKEASRKLRGTLKGITPAYAGKRAKRGRLAAGRWDHPRVCGEKSSTAILYQSWTGSPPRMRGKAMALAKLLHCHRITPAYAGKSFSYSRMPPRIGDHPRVCGEKWYEYFAPPTFLGSPPRMRGKETVKVVHVTTKRITPAYAGKSVPDAIIDVFHWDHPRVCGEKQKGKIIKKAKSGSPPRMRGKD